MPAAFCSRHHPLKTYRSKDYAPCHIRRTRQDQQQPVGEESHLGIELPAADPSCSCRKAYTPAAVLSDLMSLWVTIRCWLSLWVMIRCWHIWPPATLCQSRHRGLRKRRQATQSRLRELDPQGSLRLLCTLSLFCSFIAWHIMSCQTGVYVEMPAAKCSRRQT